MQDNLMVFESLNYLIDSRLLQQPDRPPGAGRMNNYLLLLNMSRHSRSLHM